MQAMDLHVHTVRKKQRVSIHWTKRKIRRDNAKTQQAKSRAHEGQRQKKRGSFLDSKDDGKSNPSSTFAVEFDQTGF